MEEIQKDTWKLSHEQSLRPTPAVPAESYEPIQKHKVTPSILGWLNYYIRNTLVNDSEDTNPAVPPLFSGAAVEPWPLHVAAPWQKFHHLPETYNRLQGWTRATRTPAFWEYSPSLHDYPYYWFILDPKSKHDEVKVTNLKTLPKIQSLEFCKNIYMWHIFWGCLIRCINMQWIQQLLLRIQRGHNSVHGWTGGQHETSIPHFQHRWSGGTTVRNFHYICSIGDPCCVSFRLSTRLR